MDEAQQHKEIQKGFNAGYLMEKLNPELAQKLREGITDGENPYLLGFSKGAEQYNQESFFEAPTPDYSGQELDLNSPDVDMGKELDGKDEGIEP